MDHGGTENVAGGEEADFEAVEGDDFVVVDGLDAGGGDAEALVENVAGGGGAEDALVLGEVVGVTVGNEGEFVAVMGIEKEVELRPVEGGAGVDFDEGHGGSLHPFLEEETGEGVLVGEWWGRVG